MKIEKAQQIGFCFGVKRAIKLLKKACREYGGIDSLGMPVHNLQVIEELSKLGVRIIDSLSDIRNSVVAIPSHGLGPKTVQEIAFRGLKVVDATCPIVAKTQRATKKLAEDGFQVVIFGDAAHPEVKGVLEWSQGMGMAFKGITDLREMNFSKKVGVISQTTQNLEKFIQFANEILCRALAIGSEVRIVNTICKEVRERQQEALELARRVDLMLVIGSRLSANTRRLTELCSPVVETHQIESWQEVEPGWLSKTNHLGIVSGTSTPDELIEEVLESLRRL